MRFQTTASCVTQAKFRYPAAQPLDATRCLVLADGDDVPLGTGLHLFAAHWYTVTEGGNMLIKKMAPLVAALVAVGTWSPSCPCVCR